MSDCSKTDQHNSVWNWCAIDRYARYALECCTTFWICSDTLYWSGITPIFDPITDLDLITEFDFLPNCKRFPQNICNGCGMPTEDAYSSGHLVLSHFGTCKCSNVETNISWTCLVSGFLSFEHPSVLLFLLMRKIGKVSRDIRSAWIMT